MNKKIIILVLFSLIFAGCWKTRRESSVVHTFPPAKKLECEPAAKIGLDFGNVALYLGDTLVSAKNKLEHAGFTLDEEKCMQKSCSCFFSKRSAIKEKKKDKKFKMNMRRLIGDVQFQLFSGEDNNVWAIYWESNMADNCSPPKMYITKDRCDSFKENFKLKKSRAYYGNVESSMYYSPVDNLVLTGEFAEMTIGAKPFQFCGAGAFLMNENAKFFRFVPSEIKEYFTEEK